MKPCSVHRPDESRRIARLTHQSAETRARKHLSSNLWQSLAEAGFPIELRPVSSLLPHEETIPGQLSKLTADIRSDQVQKDPLIVDRKSGVVLDGMHRLGAFANLGVEKVACYLVDYRSPGIHVKRWARVYGPVRRRDLSQVVKVLQPTREAPTSETLKLLDNRRAGFAILFGDESYVADCRPGPEVSESIKCFDEMAQTIGWQRTFVPEDDVGDVLKGGTNLALLAHRLVKQDVLDAGMTLRPFPCKTSMHTINPRPIGLNFPIGDLEKATPNSLHEFLVSCSPTMLPPGSTYSGRRYKEGLLLLNPARAFLRAGRGKHGPNKASAALV